ncbi:ribonuclease E activity regulator RraA [Acanthopleuribacter pedis]|uniref:4-hydroxy-4-methyl-2-oxoglutarate aldolase n=1 Tax=Acanthopleuribacter pedis TaxID=442870 RepID=A0A8J7Q8S3_9BACT|nr:ribonuclease E activity regulator RraA [Acanthopleuribacter pedis]MBO1319009.1 ribonuclease E activity regulator RraA [Acanthopleuribacter pedis]
MICTPDLCDAFDDLVAVADPVFRGFGRRNSFGGCIETIKCHEDNSLVREVLGEPGEGKVLVVDGGGSKRRALVGDRLAALAAENLWQGIIVYGCIRDVDEIAQIDIGLQALAAHPRKTLKKGIGERNLTVTFAGVSFKPGDFVYADNNGILVSPQALEHPQPSA